jgi:hypothetical protein
MHTVELLDQALRLAERLGFVVRQEWLAGAGGGGCEIKGQKHFFLDLALSPAEQLDQVAQAIRTAPLVESLPLSPELRRALRLRKSA